MKTITLSAHFLYKGSIPELNEELRRDNNSAFTTEWSSHNSFKFSAKRSLGTLHITGFPKAVDGIKGYAKLTPYDQNSTQVEL